MEQPRTHDNRVVYISEGEEYHTQVTFSEVHINGNVRYLCNADRLATCQQNRDGYSDCQYYGRHIICRRN
ncbi:hypothetical protein TI05_16975 [Achromatium sp. WMS3]|nr:hypothetical protein TI05_16975 [Achromatium sp. WMS3]